MNKPRYDILDGLRGVAALCVLVYHLFEAIAFAAGAPEQHFYNGFLCVDFFFLLSGFVMGYAYDDRWKDPSYLHREGQEKGMSVWDFCKRRLIRLHPMVVLGVVFGIICFCIQGCTRWDGSHVSMSVIMIGTLLSLFMIPTPLSLDERGNTEAFPLNGPHWSLFFEYLGSLVYAILLRKLSTRWLKVWVVVAFCLLFYHGLSMGSIAEGWSSETMNLYGGSLRIIFAYPMGMLMARLYREKSPSGTRLPAFVISAVALVLLLSMPSFTTLLSIVYANAIYQVMCVAIFFPMIIWFGAKGCVEGKEKAVVSYLGNLSYPLYAIHYPLIYLYIYWINTDQHPFGQGEWNTPVVLFILAVALGTICFYCYDRPVRKWLNSKLITYNS